MSRLTDRKKYSMQRTSAINRNIEWKLTFDEWINWWISTGHYHERGCKKGQYLMSRKNDLGAYELDNIECSTVEKNNSDRHKFNPYISKVMSKPIMTPKGVFNSRKEAALNYGLCSETILARMRANPTEFYYVVS